MILQLGLPYYTISSLSSFNSTLKGHHPLDLKAAEVSTVRPSTVLLSLSHILARYLTRNFLMLMEEW